jgi:hypothetical protein
VNSETAGQRRWVKVEIEATVEVVDRDAAVRAALEVLDQYQFDDADRAVNQDEIRADLAEAVNWLVDPLDILPETEGVTITAADTSTQEIDADGQPVDSAPDFAALFPVCRCGKDSCPSCAGFQLTPRTAAVLYAAAQVLADGAYDDVDAHGDEPVDGSGWMLLDRLPRLTWGQDAVWRRQTARAFDDLAADLAAGAYPRPTCPGEEMALHLVLADAPDLADPDAPGRPPELDHLPAHPDDFDWEQASETLLQDLDVLSLFDAAVDGIEDPDSDLNRVRGIGDYRPAAWFRTFTNTPARDGRRPFRR